VARRQSPTLQSSPPDDELENADDELENADAGKQVAAEFVGDDTKVSVADLEDVDHGTTITCYTSLPGLVIQTQVSQPLPRRKASETRNLAC